MGNSLQFHLLLDPETKTHTYLLADSETRQALIVDPVFENFERDAALIRSESYQLLWSLETHVHADHITGAHLLRQAFGCKIVVGQNAEVVGCDRKVRQDEKIEFGHQALQVLETPGHTQGCVSYYLKGLVMTGDSLMIFSAGRTDFQGGSAAVLYDSIQKILSLPDETKIYPGHDYQGRSYSTVAEEKKNNVRFAGKSKEEFIAIMNSLNLDPPKKIKESVPANRHCGDLSQLKK